MRILTSRPARAIVGTAIAIALIAAARQPAVAAAAARPARAAASDSADVVATIAKFHAALASGDSATAMSLLAPDALILESGSIETRADYQAHHLPADIQFARAVPSTRTVTRVVVQGDAAWVSSTSDTRGEMNGRTVNSAGAELMVLARSRDGWRIRAVHWSSRARRPA